MKNAGKIKDVFSELARTVCSTRMQELPCGPISGSLLIRGSLCLHGDAADAYFLALDKVAELARENQDWTRSSLDKALSERLSNVLAQANPTEQITQQAKLLFAQLRTHAVKWFRSVSVCGLGSDVSSFQFGALTIYPHQFTPEYDFGPYFKRGSTVSIHMAKLEVAAIDEQSADEIAKVTVERHLSVLNAIISRSCPSRFVLTTSFRDNDEIRFSSPEADGAARLAVEKLRVPTNNDRLREIVETRDGQFLSELFRKQSQLGDAILRAYEIAGEACVEENTSKAFLLFVIALESVVLGKEEPHELGFQLATRIAHLLANCLSERRECFDQIKALYGLRSKLVHNGSRSMSTSDLRLLRIMCLVALHRICEIVSLHNFTMKKELNDWFQGQILGSPAG